MEEQHPDYAASLVNLALLDEATGRFAEAADHFDQVRRSTRRHTVVLPGLSEREQLTFLKEEMEPYLHGALSLAVSRTDDEAIVTRSAGWVLNGKGLAAEAVAERARLTLLSTDPAAAQTVRELQLVRSELATRTLHPPTAEPADRRHARLTELAGREAELSKDLDRFRGDAVREEPWVELAEVRAALPADAVLIEIVHFLLFDAKTWTWSEPHYAAWVIPPAGAGEVRLVDLGSADEINAAVSEAHRSAGAPIESRAKRDLAAVRELILEPLGTEVAGAKRWFLSPDAGLWLVPYCALPLADGRYAVEDHEISLLTSGRDLVIGRKVRQDSRGGLLLADPDFDLTPKTQNPPRGQEVVAASDGAGRRAMSLAGAKWTRLEGTAKEATAVAPALEKYLGLPPTVKQKAAATEAAVMSLKSPRAVVLATHGFFLKAPPVIPSGLKCGLTPLGREVSTGPPPENPLLRCGLALAGANRLNDAAGGDGVLTGLEIAGLDLRGTEIVVLSACQTGRGETRSGEGVADLRHAFRLAGANSVVASLWNVPDESTADLMTRFWTAVAAGTPASEALRTAQLAMIEELRKSNQPAPPLLWAA